LVMWRVDWQPLPLSSDIAHNLTNEYHHNLPCNLPCVASLANHWPARTRTNGLIHKEAHPVVPDLLYHFKGTDASTALWSSSFHLLITLFEKKGPRCRRDQKMCFNTTLCMRPLSGWFRAGPGWVLALARPAFFGQCKSLISFSGYWTTCGYANSRIANSQTGRLADWSTRGLDNSQTEHRRCYRRLWVLSFHFFGHLLMFSCVHT